LASQKIEEGYDFVMMGHRHKPVCKQIGKGIYLNLGDWITHNTYAEIEDGRIELKIWTE
jgi:UDP-2,3-diacylglucosamine hydrolase